MHVSAFSARALFLALPLLVAVGCSRDADTGSASSQAGAPASDSAATASGAAAPGAPGSSAPASAGVIAPSAYAPPGAPAPLSSEARSAVDDALGAYEQLRAGLAADKVDGVAPASDRLAQSAKRASGVTSGPLQERLNGLATSAERLKGMAGGDIEQTRTAFGDVSRAMIMVVSADPTLAQGRHVFECPMASGYKKWIQTDETIANPYMGSKMLACGTKSVWTD